MFPKIAFKNKFNSDGKCRADMPLEKNLVDLDICHRLKV